MNNRERIIRYIDRQMRPEEKSRFEEELKNSSSLQNELEDCRKLLNEYHEGKDVPIDENYFVSLLPEFRTKISSGKKFKPYPVLGYGLVSAILIILISVIVLRNGEEILQTEDVISTLNDSETKYILDNYSGTDISLELAPDNSESYDSVLTSLLAENLVSGNPDLSYITDNSEDDFYNIAEDITESQAEIIYNEIINKKFF
jgi:hypothetical protein